MKKTHNYQREWAAHLSPIVAGNSARNERENIMTRDEYLEAQKQDLADELNSTARALSNIAKPIEKKPMLYREGKRDSIIRLAIKLHDLRKELQQVTDEIRRREKLRDLL